MDEKSALGLAKIVGGSAWQSGGGIWVVVRNRSDGAIVVYSGDAVCEYRDQAAFDAADASAAIVIA